MTLDDFADEIIRIADKHKALVDAQPYRLKVTEKRHLGIHLGMIRGAEKVREACRETEDLAVIAAGLEQLDDAYMLHLKELEILPEQEIAFHLGVRDGLRLVANLMRHASNWPGSIMQMVHEKLSS